MQLHYLLMHQNRFRKNWKGKTIRLREIVALFPKSIVVHCLAGF
jgi:hypothetical protein